MLLLRAHSRRLIFTRAGRGEAAFRRNAETQAINPLQPLIPARAYGRLQDRPPQKAETRESLAEHFGLDTFAHLH